MDTPTIAILASPKDFVLAGNARFTLVNEETGNRLTYRVRECEDKPSLHFVSVLSGPDNENHYSYLGCIWDGQTYKHGAKSKISEDAQSAKAFTWLWKRLDSGAELPEQVKVYHEGYCGRCGRLLTVPESVESGFGPVCTKLMYPYTTIPEAIEKR